MKKRTTSWNLLDFLLIGLSGLAMANKWQTATRMLSPPHLQSIYRLLFSEIMVASVIAMVLLVLVLRRFDSLAERLVGTACIWGMWYLLLATLFSDLVYRDL